MSVRAHGDELDRLRARQFDDFFSWLAHGQDGGDIKSFRLQFALEICEINTVFLHLFALAQFEILVVPRHPSVGDMHQHQLGIRHPGERADVLENGLVRLAIFDRDQDCLIHAVLG